MGDDSTEEWCVYILKCSDGTLYAGATNNMKRRLESHNDGSGANYTHSRRPVELVYQEHCGNRSEALKREAAIKKLSRREKIALLSQTER